MDMLRVGRQFRALRIRLERRQSDVARDACVSRSLVVSIDPGQLAGVTLGALGRAAAAFGADLDVRLRLRGETLDRLLDEDHAAIVEALVRRLAAARRRALGRATERPRSIAQPEDPVLSFALDWRRERSAFACRSNVGNTFARRGQP